AGLYEDQRRFSDLADALERAAAVASDPRRAASLLYRFGQVCLGRLYGEERANTAFRATLAPAPEHQPVRRALGTVYARRERFADLIELLDDEAERTPDPARKASQLYRIGDLFERKLADLERAQNTYERALAAHAGYDPALAGLARVCD